MFSGLQQIKNLMVDYIFPAENRKFSVEWAFATHCWPPQHYQNIFTSLVLAREAMANGVLAEKWTPGSTEVSVVDKCLLSGA